MRLRAFLHWRLAILVRFTYCNAGLEIRSKLRESTCKAEDVACRQISERYLQLAQALRPYTSQHLRTGSSGTTRDLLFVDVVRPPSLGVADRYRFWLPPSNSRKRLNYAGPWTKWRTLGRAGSSPAVLFYGSRV